MAKSWFLELPEKKPVKEEKYFFFLVFDEFFDRLET